MAFYKRNAILNNYVRPLQSIRVGDSVHIEASKEYAKIVNNIVGQLYIITPETDLSVLATIETGLILISHGEYLIDQSITISTDCHLLATGQAVFKWSGDAGATMLTLSERVALEGIWFDKQTNDYLPVAVTSNSCIRRCRFANITTAIKPAVSPSEDIIIEDCVFDTITNAYYADSGTLRRWRFKTNKYNNVTTVYNFTGATIEDMVYVYDGVE